ncbi:MAG: SpoIIE family protein phosphatase [Oliverpabstia sp.]|nr:SpoIIE family protein phosphatase [Oliverpabstia sp.]
MNEKRKPIRRKVQWMVFSIAVAALLLTSAVGISSMMKIRKYSEDALITQMEQNLYNIVTDKAELADIQLEGYAGYIQDFSSYIHKLYLNPSAYLKKEVLPPNPENKGTYSLQRALTGTDISLEEINDEMGLLGNLEQVWDPVITANSEIITTIYIGTESGFMISYDAYAAEDSEGNYEEAYYDYFATEWYQEAKHAEKAVFTDLYVDYYGRGLMISCVAPFYDADDNFAGVVGMDIRMTDLHRSVIDINLGEEASAFLVDNTGDVIGSPEQLENGHGFESIYKESNPAHVAAKKIMSGEKGIYLTEDGIYYAYTPVKTADWKFCVEIPKSVVLEPVSAVTQNIQSTIIVFGFFFVIIILLVVAIVNRFSKRLTDPLLALGRDVKTISGGNLDYRAQVRCNDEIGDLAGEFNQMAASLKQYIHDFTAVVAEKERIGAELDIATHIQSSMLPCIFPAFPERKEIDIYATMNPAKEVGGDFYDFFMVDDRHLAIVMADVSGKGVPAALFMVIGKTLIKDHTQPGRNLGEVFTEVNNILCESNSEGLFITAFEGVLDMVTGEFRFVNAGHEMPYICKKDGNYEVYKIRAGFVLAGMEGIRYREGCVQLEPGDKIFQYTDGVTEATDSKNELYGMDRLTSILNRNVDKTPMELLPEVKKDIDAFVGDAPQFDDITMLCLEYKERMEVKEK